jgi:hypothetical protein
VPMSVSKARHVSLLAGSQMYAVAWTMGMVIIYKAVREARGRRMHPKLHGHLFFQLVPTLGPSTCVQPARSTHTTARQALLIRAAAARAG